MAATMTQNQIGWKQFASTLIQRECDRNDEHDQGPDNSDAATSTTNTRASRALKQKQSKQSDTAKNVKWSKTKIVFTMNEQQPTEEPAAFDEPTKAKTRAQRRAVEEIPAPAPVEKETRREQRSDYWVTRDDRSRSIARAMKAMKTME